MSGASGRLWATNDGRGRIELQSDAGDVQIVWNHDDGHRLRRLLEHRLPGEAACSEATRPPLRQGRAACAVRDRRFLSKLGAHATISAAQPDNVAGQPAYSVTVSPKHDGGLLGSAELAWDAARGVPLRIAIYAQGSSSPALALEATEISYGPVPASDVDVSPPADAKVVDLAQRPGNGSSAGRRDRAGDRARRRSGRGRLPRHRARHARGPAAQGRAPRRRPTRRCSSSTARASERSSSSSARPTTQDPAGRRALQPARPCRSTASRRMSSRRSSEPPSTWRSGGIAYVLAGSLPPAAAEAAARAAASERAAPGRGAGARQDATARSPRSTTST